MKVHVAASTTQAARFRLLIFYRVFDGCHVNKIAIIDKKGLSTLGMGKKMWKIVDL